MNGAGDDGARPHPAEAAAYEQLQFYTLAHADPAFVHQYVVDAWAAQQAGSSTKPIRLTFALIGLYLHTQKGFTGREVQRVHMRLAQRRHQWPQWTLPRTRGEVTAARIMAVPPGADRDRAIDAWCRSVWAAFGAHRGALERLLREHGIL